VPTNLPFPIIVCGIGDLSGHSRANVSHVLSILDPGAPVPADFDVFHPHERLELRFHDIIAEYPGMECPRVEHIEQLLQFAQQAREQPGQAHLLVHCHAGISRSPASAILMLAQLRPELPAATVIKELLPLRPRMWPNLRMIELGDALLGRDGELIRAVHSLYALMLQQDPALKALISALGRTREIEAALSNGRAEEVEEACAVNEPPSSEHLQRD
jgi:predicted protein tyrosine phosphatase